MQLTTARFRLEMARASTFAAKPGQPGANKKPPCPARLF